MLIYISLSMTSAESSFALMRAIQSANNGNGTGKPEEKRPIPIFRYIDIDSTRRNRFNNPNPNNFVIPMLYPGRNSDSMSAIDPVSLAFPYHSPMNSTLTPPYPTGVYQTSAGSIIPTEVVLDTRETEIDNFYANAYLQIGSEYKLITAYDGTTLTATIESAFVAFPAGVPITTTYLTRRAIPIYTGTVTAVTSNQVFSIVGASSVPNIFVGGYITFTSGANTDLYRKIVAYTGLLTNTVTVETAFPNAVNIGDAMEIDAFSYDNANPLFYSGDPSTSTNTYYEIELLWLSVPNQIMGVGYGGTPDKYPVIYVRLYNEGHQLANQVLYSNNGDASPNALFVTPVNEYYGDTTFLTLKDCRMRQIVKFIPNQDLRFTLTLPSGEIMEYATDDTLSPMAPNPFLQVHALFSLRKLDRL